MKGLFIEMNLDGRIIFSCAMNKVTREDFDKLWSVAGNRIFDQSAKALSENRSLRYGEIRISPITD